MAENNTPANKESENATIETDTSSTPRRQKPSQFKAFAALVLSLLTLLSLIYIFYTLQQVKQGSARQIELLHAETDAVKAEHHEALSQIKQSVGDLQQTQQQLQQKLATIDKNLESALKQSRYQTSDWLLLKARYFLELAQINAHWNYDPQSTQSLLSEADALLAKMHDEHLFAIRQAIAEEIASLQAAPKVDVAGILSQLDALQDNIADLPLKASIAKLDNGKTSAPQQEANAGWRNRLQATLNELGKLVVIRRHDETITPLLSAKQAALLRTMIRADFKEAQLAVLQHNEAVYLLSLKQAERSIRQTFDTNAGSTQAILHQLQILAQKPLKPEKPNLQRVLDQLNQLLESRNQVNTARKTKEQSS